MWYSSFIWYLQYHIACYSIYGRHAESCVHRVVRQMIGLINIILSSNISYKRDGVAYFLFLIAIYIDI